MEIKVYRHNILMAKLPLNNGSDPFFERHWEWELN